MSDLVVISFPNEAKAEEVRQKLLAMQKEYLLELGDAVIAVKDDQGDQHHHQQGKTPDQVEALHIELEDRSELIHRQPPGSSATASKATGWRWHNTRRG